MAAFRITGGQPLNAADRKTRHKPDKWNPIIKRQPQRLHFTIRQIRPQWNEFVSPHIVFII